MEFEFKKKEGEFDERSEFANRVCKLLVQKNRGNIINSLKEVETFYSDFDIHVRNIYELIDREIPLFALYELRKNGADNYGLSDEEYKAAIKRAEKACIDYYRT